MFGKNDAIRIETELGAGGSGAVFKAWHTRLRKHVVITEIRSVEANDAESRRNEVEALKNIKSAYVPLVFDFLTESAGSYTVMEFVEGESLDKLLARGVKFSESQVIKWYIQLVTALETIHKQDVFHRDIKPANIMLTPGGDVCLIDFNAAMIGGNGTHHVSRSLGYASPEQNQIFQRLENARTGHASPNLQQHALHSDRPGFIETQLLDNDCQTEVRITNSIAAAPLLLGNIDWKRSDIYSLGAAMYHLLTGRRPPERAEDIIPISKLGRFNKGLVSVIELSMQIEPKKRYASAIQLAEALRNIDKGRYEQRHTHVKKAAVITTIVIITAFVVYRKKTYHNSR